MIQKSLIRFAILLLVTAAIHATAFAVAPSPDASEKWRADGIYEQKIAALKSLRAAGACGPEAHSVFRGSRSRTSMALADGTVDTAKVIVILIDFPDHQWTGQSVAGTPEMFDSLLFSDPTRDTIINNFGSMTEYFMEDSYGKFYMMGDVFGWYRMPKNYSVYVGGDGGTAMSQTLANLAIDAAIADGANFQNYDHDNDQQCDGVLIVHAGPGGETVGGDIAIWSHKWNLPGAGRFEDGVRISGYTHNPEEFGGSGLSPIGVFVHEFGHMLGLPDLYDVNGTIPSDGPQTSDGLGRWELMATGNYNNSSRKPAHMSAWCKNEIGFLNLTTVTGNLYNAEIPQVETEGVAYKLSNSIAPAAEYWIVENRQKVGFDVGLPGEGLCIYHVDNNATPQNADQFRYFVALEQADGKNELAEELNTGDEGDPFPGFEKNRNFHTLTTPNSLSNGGFMTEIGVWNITDSDSLMYADLDITYSRPYVQLSGPDSLVLVDLGNGDGVLDPGESFEIYVTADNLMRTAYNVKLSVSTSNSGITFASNNVEFSTIFSGGGHSNAGNPVIFTLDTELDPKIDTLMISVIADSLPGIAGSANFAMAVPLEVMIAPQVLIVDDDRGSPYQAIYQKALHGIGVPYATLDQADKAPVNAEALNDFRMVFWLTGDSTVGAISVDDIAAMKSYMDGGGNLLLSTLSGVSDMHALDSAFMANYFHAYRKGAAWDFRFRGKAGTEFGDGAPRFRYASASVNPEVDRVIQLIEPLNGGEAVLNLQNVSSFNIGVSYTGSFKSILLSIPIELLIEDNLYLPPDSMVARVVNYFGGTATAVWDGQPFSSLPSSFELNQNYPNPFNPTTTISYTVRPTRNDDGSPQRTELNVYNILGQHVRTLVDKVQIPGSYEIEWDGNNAGGRRVASGVYFYRLTLGGESATKKMLLVK